jgi:hypothetical protein
MAKVAMTSVCCINSSCPTHSGNSLEPGLRPKHRRVRYNCWRTYDQPLAERPTEHRYIRESIFGKRRAVRYYQMTKGQYRQSR